MKSVIHNHYFKKLYVFTIYLARTIVPFLIFKWPLLGILVCFTVDALDHTFLLVGNVRVDKKPLFNRYQNFDKIFDQYYYTFILIYIIFNLPSQIVEFSIILYSLRLTGAILYLLTKNNLYPLIMANYFENFAVAIFFGLAYLALPMNTLIIWAIALSLITKIPQELIIYRRHTQMGPGTAFHQANFLRKLLHLSPLNP